ncbi:hypothetical protein CW696_07710 [ANME-2 cluster archaeon]|nr:MAG: hypothetical protein CW696_07710 [ANME-2 cluster archaeon]
MENPGTSINTQIPESALNKAVERLRRQGFRHRVDLQAARMIAEVTEIVEALGGSIIWREP